MTTLEPRTLPPGQVEAKTFPRFGLGRFARRFPRDPHGLDVVLRGDVATEVALGERLATLPRVELEADFHCVTTWSVRDLRWGGWRFREVYETLVVPLAKPAADATLLVLRGADGYCSSLPLVDALADDVLLADTLDGAPLGLAHGAPLRLVAPAHYGYKNCKHLAAIELWRDARNYRFPRPYPKLMDHPRARVAPEERGRFVPAWLLRPIYRLLVPSTVRAFERALGEHERDQP